MSENSQAIETPSDRELSTERFFNALPAQIFEAFRNPQKLARWWGPKGFTNTFHEFEFKPGGIWRFTMHAPDGTNFLNESRFAEIASPDRIVIHHLSGHFFELQINLEKQHTGTRLTWLMRFESKEECDKIRPYVLEANEQNLDRLTAEL